MLVLFLELDVLDKVVRRVLQDDELMGNDTIQDLLLLVLRNVIDEAGLVELSLTAMVTLLAVQDLVDVHLLGAAIVFVA
jgi:hypothetical protein